MKFYRIYIELSDICNLNCSFCTPKKSMRKIMPLVLFDKITTQIKNKTYLVSLHVLGDPLCLDNLESYLNILESKNISTDIVSSGIFLQDSHFEILCKKNIHQISFSLDAFYDKNNKFVNLSQEEYFDKIFKLYDYMKNKNVKIFLNLRSFRQRDFEYILQKFPNYKEDLHNRRIRLDSRFFIRFHEYFKWYKPHISPQKLKINKKECLGGIKQLAILSNGIVVPCCIDTEGIMKLGDFNKDNFKDIVESSISFSGEMCNGCNFRGI